MSDQMVSEPDETPDLEGAFPRLSDTQVTELSVIGTRRETAENEVLVREGELPVDFVVVLAGRVAIVESLGDGLERVVAVHGPGRFLGELGLLTGQPAFLSAVVRTPGEILSVPLTRLRDATIADPHLGDLVLRALLVRRSLQIGLGTGLRILGSRFSSDTRRLREFMARNRLPHRFVDLEEDREAEDLLRELGLTPDETPVVIWQGRRVMRNPSNADLAEVIGLRHRDPPEGIRDLAIVGAGPAGLAAAVYGASEGLQTVVLEAVATGGQAGTAACIENYLGFPAGISGGELTDLAVLQARKFGARIDVPSKVTGVEAVDGHYVLEIERGAPVRARAVVVATGARYRRLDVPRLDDFESTSVYYAATEVEASLCRHDPVVVVGGGNSAGQAAVFLSRRVPAVHLLVRAPELGADMSRYLADRVVRTPRVTVSLCTEVRELVGERSLEAVRVHDLSTGENRLVEARALFVFIGAFPQTSWLAGSVALDDDGFVRTGPGVSAQADHAPTILECSLPGVYAVGDVRSGSVKRVASAVGEGAMAVRFVHDHLKRVWGSAPR